MTTINLTYNWIDWSCELRISGHSGYEVQGKDIICACVSTILCTTINFANSTKPPMLIKQYIQTGTNASSICKFQVKNNIMRAYALMLEKQFGEIQRQYPQYVSLNVERIKK